MQKNDLVTGKVSKVLLLFVIPLIAGSLIQQLYTTIDAVIVGKFVGREGLAAIDSVHTLFKFPINFMNGLASGATIIISRFYGARDSKKIGAAIKAALFVAIFLGIISSIAGVILCGNLLGILKVPKEIFGETKIYTSIFFAGLWTMILYNMVAGIIRAFGDSKRPLYILIICSVVNIIGDFILVGVFSMGVKGAAIATIFAQTISMVIVLWLLRDYLCKKKIISKNNIANKYNILRNVFDLEKTQLKEMIKIGIPLALQSMLFPIANTIVQASVNNMGTNSIAAWGICDKMDMLIWLIADAMGPALTTYTAQNLGAKKKERVKKGAYIGTGISVLLVAVVSLILYVGANVIGAWFISTEDVNIILPYVEKYMRMMAPFFVFYAVAEGFSGAVCGLGNTIEPMITTLVTICLLRVLGVIFILPAYNSMECIVWIYIVTWIVAGIAFFVLYDIKFKKIIR